MSIGDSMALPAAGNKTARHRRRERLQEIG